MQQLRGVYVRVISTHLPNFCSLSKKKGELTFPNSQQLGHFVDMMSSVSPNLGTAPTDHCGRWASSLFLCERINLCAEIEINLVK